MLVPAGMTEFAKDKTFGYHASDLTEYVEEKTGGLYKKESCICITLEELREQRVEDIRKKLLSAQNFAKIIVNATTYEELAVFCGVYAEAVEAGKKFLARTAAAFPKVLGGVSDQPLLGKKDIIGERRAAPGGGENGGIVLIGSHVKKTTRQLECLMESKAALEFMEFDVNTCFEPEGLKKEAKRVSAQAEAVIKSGRTAVVYTSRKLLVPKEEDADRILKASVEISGAVTSVIGQLHVKPAFIIAKGGITSSDVGTKALQVKKAVVMGQIQKGIPVWMTGEESRFPGMPYIIFPGNVGDVDTLRRIVEELV